MSKEKLNIIYVVCHDLGRHLGVYGADVKTPVLDKFAKENVTFTKAFGNSAVCSPSRGCAMSGRYSHNNGVVGLTQFGWRFYDDVKTIVDYMKEIDYYTVHCGLSHEGEEGNHRYDMDFEVSWRSRGVENAVDDAITYLRSHKEDDKPFYMNVGLQEVHGCVWDSPTAVTDKTSRLNTIYGGPTPTEDTYLPNFFPNRPEYVNMMSRFQSSVEYMDKELERLFDTIEEYGYSENTVVVFTTDHGITGLRAKGTLYETGTGISLMVQMPKKYKKPMTFNHLIQNIDFNSTFLEAVGADIPSELQGKSFWKLLTDEDYTPHEHIFTEWNFGGPIDDYKPIRTIRTHKYHYIRNYGKPPKYWWLKDEVPVDYDYKNYENEYGGPGIDCKRAGLEDELYDLTNDSDEYKNLNNDTSLKEIKKDLSDKIDQWMQDTNDFVLTNKIPKLPAEPGWGKLY